MIICDTREKKNEHILKYFEDHKIEYRKMKLETGDYMDDACMNVSVDRKQNLHELVMNLCSTDKSRFWRELRRAQKEHTRLFVLCEHGENFCTLADVCKYKDPYSSVSGRELQKKMYAVKVAYGVQFLFCDKDHTAEVILDILAGQDISVG